MYSHETLMSVEGSLAAVPIMLRSLQSFKASPFFAGSFIARHSLGRHSIVRAFLGRPAICTSRQSSSIARITAQAASRFSNNSIAIMSAPKRSLHETKTVDAPSPTAMAPSASPDAPPPAIPSFDRAAFGRNVEVMALRVAAPECAVYIKALRPYVILLLPMACSLRLDLNPNIDMCFASFIHSFAQAHVREKGRS